VSEDRRIAIKEQIDKWLDKGIIRESTSPWASPCVVVAKQLADGSIKRRVCGCFMRVNDLLRRETFPIPNMQDLFDELSGSTVFSVIDLENAFLQLPLRETDKEKTAIITGEGLFEFNFLPFGISNASEVMQRTMSRLFGKYRGKFAGSFIDDLCVHSKDRSAHPEHLEIVFNILADYGLIINLPKCRFFRDRVLYLGCWIDGKSIWPDSKNVETVRNWPYPTSAKQVRQFLGCSSFYRRFIKDFSNRTAALRELTKKNAKFIWTAYHQEEFQDIKGALTEKPVLRLFEVGRDTVVRTDASDLGLGVILEQRYPNGLHPVFYASQAFTHHAKKWVATEKECFAIMFALKKFHKYLQGIQFVVMTEAILYVGYFF